MFLILYWPVASVSTHYCQIQQCTFSSCRSPLPGAKPLHCFNIHHCLVNTVQRSPFFKDIILTGPSPTGSWNFAIWKEGIMVVAPVNLTTLTDKKTLTATSISSLTEHDLCKVNKYKYLNHNFPFFPFNFPLIN